jgi:hypothetical protein
MLEVQSLALSKPMLRESITAQKYFAVELRKLGSGFSYHPVAACRSPESVILPGPDLADLRRVVLSVHKDPGFVELASLAATSELSATSP